MNLFFEKKIVILPRIIKNSGIFKILCARSVLMYTSVINDEIIDMSPKAKIIVFNKELFENIETDLGIKRRMIKTNILSEKEILDKNNNVIKIFNRELIEKTWHPNRFKEWCLSIDELKELN
jgi:hypothetical protein